MNAAAPSAVVVDPERSHELGQRTTQNEFTALGPYGFGTEPRKDQARQVAEGELPVALITKLYGPLRRTYRCWLPGCFGADCTAPSFAP